MARLHEGELLTRPRTNPELEDASVSDEIVAAPQNAGVRERVPEIVLAQIGVRVEVDDDDVRILLLHRAERAERDEVLATEEERTFPVLQDPRGPLLDHLERGLRGAERQLEVARVEDLRVSDEILVLRRRIGLNAEALLPHRGRPEAGARTERRGRIVGRPEEDRIRLAVGLVASDELTGLGSHRRFSSLSMS